MEQFLELSGEQRVIFFISVATRSLSLINDTEQAIIANKALDCCWDQIIDKKYDGEILYDYLDNEENGITIFAEMSDNEKESAAWNCVIDAVAFASRYAYDTEKVNYYPEPISLVDDKLVEHLKKCYSECLLDEEFIKTLFKILLSNKDTDIRKLRNILYSILE